MNVNKLQNGMILMGKFSSLFGYQVEFSQQWSLVLYYFCLAFFALPEKIIEHPVDFYFLTPSKLYQGHLLAVQSTHKFHQSRGL